MKFRTDAHGAQQRVLEVIERLGGDAIAVEAELKGVHTPQQIDALARAAGLERWCIAGGERYMTAEEAKAWHERRLAPAGPAGPAAKPNYTGHPASSTAAHVPAASAPTSQSSSPADQPSANPGSAKSSTTLTLASVYERRVAAMRRSPGHDGATAAEQKKQASSADIFARRRSDVERANS